MCEKYLLRSNQTLSNKHINDVTTGASQDAIKAIGSNITISDVHCVDMIGRTEAHCDFIQLIPSNNYLRYFGEIAENIKITDCSLDSDGSMQGIFSSDGALRNPTIKDFTVTTQSEHDVSLCGVLDNCTILDVTDIFGNPARVMLDNLRIGGGAKGNFYVSSFKPGTYEYGVVETCQAIDDRRGKKWRDAEYVDNFDLDLWYNIAKSIKYDSVERHLDACDAEYHKQTSVKLRDYKLSDQGLNDLLHEEGYRDTMYQDTKGLDTIGVGHLITPEEHATGVIRLSTGEKLGIHTKWTKKQVMQLLRDDLYRFRKSVNKLKNNINQGQFDALLSFAFNIGVSGFERSTAFRRVSQKRHDKVPDAMMLWKKPVSIINRRKREAMRYRMATQGNRIKNAHFEPKHKKAILAGNKLSFAELKTALEILNS